MQFGIALTILHEFMVNPTIPQTEFLSHKPLACIMEANLVGTKCYKGKY